MDFHGHATAIYAKHRVLPGIAAAQHDTKLPRDAKRRR